MTESEQFLIKPSNSYNLLSLVIHLMALMAVWLYPINSYISALISVFIIYHWYTLLQKILLKTPDSIRLIKLNKELISLKDNTGKLIQYPQFFCTYQSHFLVIINVGKQSVVLFKDSMADQSLSKLNLTLNVKR